MHQRGSICVRPVALSCPARTWQANGQKEEGEGDANGVGPHGSERREGRKVWCGGEVEASRAKKRKRKGRKRNVSGRKKEKRLGRKKKKCPERKGILAHEKNLELK